MGVEGHTNTRRARGRVRAQIFLLPPTTTHSTPRRRCLVLVDDVGLNSYLLRPCSSRHPPPTTSRRIRVLEPPFVCNTIFARQRRRSPMFAHALDIDCTA